MKGKTYTGIGDMWKTLWSPYTHEVRVTEGRKEEENGSQVLLK